MNHGEAELETRHGADADESPLDPLCHIAASAARWSRPIADRSISQIVVTTRRETGRQDRPFHPDQVFHRQARSGMLKTDRNREEAIVLAYDFPLLSLVWAMFWFFVMLSIVFAVIWAFIDNFRRRDYGGWAKAGWALVILVIPFIGMLIYLAMRPADALDPL